MSKVYLSAEEDPKLVRFLWDWKVSTTALLCRKFFPNTSPPVAYKRLWRLERAGYIRTEVDKGGSHYFWTLTKKGFGTLLPDLPPLKEEGFLSENGRHDYAVAVCQLGNWSFGLPPNLSVFTEQWLRRIDPEFYPPWVPKSTAHVPDGYWLVKSTDKNQVVALEVELNSKRMVDYESTASFYENQRGIGKVLWVVSRPGIANIIQRAVAKVTDTQSKHSFALFKDICAQDRNARIQLGPDKGFSISEVLGNKVETNMESVSPMFLHNTTKSPHRSTRSAEIITRKFCNWIGL